MPVVTVRTMFELSRIVGRSAVQLTLGAGATVRTVLEELVAAHSGLQGRLFDPGTGDLLAYLFIELNGRDVRSLQGLETPVGEGDSLSVLMPVAGGAQEEGIRPFLT
jgi:MoaD family protein